MKKIILSDNEKIICKSKTTKEIWIVCFVSIVVSAAGLFIMFLPLMPTIELAVAPVVVILAGIAFFSVGVVIFVFSIRFIRIYKNIQLILTDKRVSIYDKNQHNYKDINLIDISAWDGVFNSFSSDNSDKITWTANFTFWTSTTVITTGKIANCYEMEKALSQFIPVKSYSKMRQQSKLGRS